MPKQLTKAQQMGEEEAFPVPADAEHYGLTKREYFAAMAMQGLLSHRTVPTGNEVEYFRKVASQAAVAADGLLEALNA